MLNKFKYDYNKLTNTAYYLFSNKKLIMLKMIIFATDEKLIFLDINRIYGNIIDLIDEAIIDFFNSSKNCGRISMINFDKNRLLTSLDLISGNKVKKWLLCTIWQEC